MNKFLSKIVGSVLAITVLLVSVAPAEARMLSQGTRGDDVSALQTWLIGNGYTIPLIESGVANKGFFGEQTKNAVMMYQENRGSTENGIIDSETVFSNEAKLGSAVGPDLLSPFASINSVRTWYYSIPFINSSGTTTLCSIKLPQATTTYQFSMNINSLASTTDVEVGYDTYSTGTSTILGKIQTLVPQGGGQLFGSSATTSSLSFIPGTIGTTTYRYLNFKVGTAGISGATPYTNGICKVALTEADTVN